MARQVKGADIDYAAQVNRTYGVVPRPRSSVCPEAWARTKRPGKWRAYYGYRYNPEGRVPEAGKPGDKYSDAQVAAAKIAHDERGGRVAAFEPSADEKRAAFVAEAAILRKPEPAAAAPAPVREPEPVPMPDPRRRLSSLLRLCPAPAEAVACTCEHDRLAQAAAVLRDLAAKYGPRRAHKLLAMADFVTAAAGIAA